MRGFYCISGFVSVLRGRSRVALCSTLHHCCGPAGEDAARMPPAAQPLSPSWSVRNQPKPRSLRFNVHCEMFVIINYDNSENPSHK